MRHTAIRTATLPNAAVLAVIIFNTLGCATSADMDGRYWRQPTAKTRVRAVSYGVASAGRTVEAGVGAGVYVCDSGDETGGPAVGRHGETATMGVHGRTVAIGEIYDAPRSGVTGEHRNYTDTVGHTMQSSSYTETTARVGVQRVGD